MGPSGNFHNSSSSHVHQCHQAKLLSRIRPSSARLTKMPSPSYCHESSVVPIYASRLGLELHQTPIWRSGTCIWRSRTCIWRSGDVPLDNLGRRASGFKMREISTSMSSTNLAVSTISLITPWLNCENDPNDNHASQLSCENNPNPLLPIKSFTMPRLDGQGQTSCGWWSGQGSLTMSVDEGVTLIEIKARYTQGLELATSTNISIKVDRFAPFIS